MRISLFLPGTSLVFSLAVGLMCVSQSLYAETITVKPSQVTSPLFGNEVWKSEPIVGVYGAGSVVDIEFQDSQLVVQDTFFGSDESFYLEFGGSNPNASFGFTVELLGSDGSVIKTFSGVGTTNAFGVFEDTIDVEFTNGKVTVTDLRITFSGKMQTSGFRIGLGGDSTVATPEPATFAPAALFGLTIGLWRRRKAAARQVDAEERSDT